MKYTRRIFIIFLLFYFKLNGQTVDYPSAVPNWVNDCNYGSNRSTTNIDTFIIHWIGSGTVEGAINWFNTCPGSDSGQRGFIPGTSKLFGPSSAHFIISENGDIQQLVPIDKVAYHAKGVNTRSIGVEHEATLNNPEFWDSAKLIKSSVNLACHFTDLLNISTKRGVPGIEGHTFVPTVTSGTKCPGSIDWDNWFQMLEINCSLCSSVAFEPNNTIKNATNLSNLGSCINNFKSIFTSIDLSQGDEDIYRVDVSYLGELEITLLFENNLFLELLDSKGNIIDSGNLLANGNRFISWTGGLASGGCLQPLYIRVTPKLSGNKCYNYSLQINWKTDSQCPTNSDQSKKSKSTNININGNRDICIGESTTLVASGGSGNYTWFLNQMEVGNSNPITINNFQDGINEIVVLDKDIACYIGTTTVNVTSKITANAGSDKTIEKGKSIQLQGSGGSSYSWSPTTGLSNPNIFNPIASPTETTTYTLTVSENGCTDIDTVTVIVDGGSTTNNTPTNDDCSDAINLTSNTSCNTTSGTIDYATADGIDNKPSCDAIQNPNALGVFYSFTATSKTHTVKVNPTGILDAVLTLYSGSSCSNLTEFACDDTPKVGNATVTKNNFVVGQKYWIRVYDYGTVEPKIGKGGFTICVTHPQVNNGTGPDLISEITSISKSNPDTGDNVTVNYTVTNIGDEATKFWLVPALRLSTNTTFGSSDTDLASGSIQQIISPNETVTLSTKFKVPNVSDDKYYVLVEPDIADVIKESDEDNNVSSYPIQIGEVKERGVNLDIKGLTITPNNNLAPNQEVNIQVEIENEGTKDSGKFTVALVFDANNNGLYDASTDIIIEERTISDIEDGERKEKDYDTFLPSNISSTGTYRIIAIADFNNDINETNENDNTKTRDIFITTLNPAGPDLIGIFEGIKDKNDNTINTHSLCLNVEYDFEFKFKNQGSREASGNGKFIDGEAFISKDRHIDGADFRIGRVSGGSTTLGVNTSSGIRDQDKELEGLAPGNYFLIFQVDDDNRVEEINENNNITVTPITIKNCNNDKLADLSVSILSVTPYNTKLGNTQNIKIRVTNNGDIDVDSFRIAAFVSDDETFHGDGGNGIFNDHKLVNSNSTYREVLSPNQSIDIEVDGYIANISRGLQKKLSTGINYIFVEIGDGDKFNEYDKTNNIAYSPINITSTDCFYVFDREQNTVAHDVTSVPFVEVDTDDECTFTANAREDWITRPKNQSFTGKNFVFGFLNKNPYPFPRKGHIDIGNKVFEFIQEAKPCSELDDAIKMEIISNDIGNIGCDVKGYINIDITKGFPPYTYSWSNGSSEKNLKDLESTGSYTVTVSDIAGCSIQKTFEVTNDFNIDNTITNNDGILIANQNNVNYQWYLCENGTYIKLENETQQTFTPKELGSYAVVVYTDSCSKRSSCITISTLSTASIQEENIFNLFPNPVSKLLNIKTPIIYNNKSIIIVIYDTSGKQLRKITKHINNSRLEINVEDLSNGLYLLNFNLENKAWSQVFVKK